MKLMLDTDICIYLIKQHPPSVLERFLSHPVGDIGISSTRDYGYERLIVAQLDSKPCRRSPLGFEGTSMQRIAVRTHEVAS